MDRKKRIITILVVAVFTMVATFSLFFAAHESGHCCCLNEECYVCAVLSSCSDIKGQLGGAAPTSGTFAISMLFTVLLVMSAAAVVTLSTPVILKVKLSF